MRISRAWALAAFSASAVAAASRPAASQARVALKLVAPANDSATNALYALHAGSFARAGLDVELIPMNSGATVAAAVAGGAANIGLSSLVTIIEGHTRGVPFTVVAPSGVFDGTVQFAAFVVRKDNPIVSPRELNGKLIASPGLKDLNAVAIMAYVDRAGGDSRTIHFVELSQPASVAAIVEGRIDGAILGTPSLTSAVQSGKIRVLGNPFEAIATRFQHIAWFTTQSFAEQNRNAIERFSRVLRDASLYCNEHPADTAPLVAQFDGIDVKVVESAVRVPFAEYVDARLIQPLIDAVARYKLIDHSFNAAEIVSPFAVRPPR